MYDKIKIFETLLKIVTDLILVRSSNDKCERISSNASSFRSKMFNGVDVCCERDIIAADDCLSLIFRENLSISEVKARCEDQTQFAEE